MTSEAKLAMVKAILRIDSTDTSEDVLITTYLDMAAQEILGWRYSNANPDNVPETVPTEYEMTQVQAVYLNARLTKFPDEIGVLVLKGKDFHMVALRHHRDVVG